MISALPAEITFGSWGRALWVTAANANDKDDDSNQIVSDVHQSWGGTSAPRTALSVHGSSDNVGFDLDIFGNGTSLGLGDWADIWVKPIEQVKIAVGQMDDTTLRGDCVNGLWGWDRIGCVDGDEGWTFNGYFQNKGVNIQVTPIQGLLLGVAIPLVLDHKASWEGDYDHNATAIKKDNEYTLSGIYAHSAAYVGAYTIEGVGTIKAALKTEPKSGDDSHVKLGVAFDLTAVENLFVSVGAKIDTLDKTAKIINAYGRYGVNEQLAIHARVGTKLSTPYTTDKNENKDDGFGFLAGVGVDYNLDGGIGLFADIRYANGIYFSGSDADNSDNLTFGLGVTKGYSNGLIGIAFEGSTNNGGRYELKDADAFAWEIPVKFEYWF